MDSQINPVIRRLGRADFPLFYPLFVDMVKNEIPELLKKSDFFLEGDFSRERIYGSLSYPSIVIIGCFLKDRLIGFIWGNAGYAGLGFISWLMVEKDYRKKGYGKKLMNTYEDFIRGIKGHVVELYCFEEMKEFYEKNGYEVIGVRPKGYFGLKQFIMEKIFAS